MNSTHTSTNILPVFDFQYIMMDDSMSSDVFPDITEISSPIHCKVQYETLVCNAKSLLSSNIEGELDITSFYKLLEDCEASITQSFDLLIGVLKEELKQLDVLIDYLGNAVCLLKMLLDFLKKIIATMTMTSCNSESFPTMMGSIIRTVFSHCKNSDSVYGEHLTSVKTQLTDLFKSCHDLQTTYLKMLEKHFIFDLTVEKDQNIFLEALNINLRIGELVQRLDVKTMAEQWKAYIVICKKYSSFLADKDVFYKTSENVCQIVIYNINHAAEAMQDERIVLRSLKVASFMITVLNKMCDIHMPCSVDSHNYILEMFLNVHRYNGAYMELTGKQSSTFSNLLEDNVLPSSENLLRALLLDGTFVRRLLTYDNGKIKQPGRMISLILLVTSMMKITIQMNNVTAPLLKNHLIAYVYNILPYCHVWFNLGFKFRHKTEQSTTMGLFENLLTHAMALALTMDCAEFNALEKVLIEGILSTDLYTALFSSNLTVCLARVTQPALSLKRVRILIMLYKEFEQNVKFFHTPQYVHLKYTLSETFNLLKPDDKIKIYEEYSIDKTENLNLWSALKISNLPLKVLNKATHLAIMNFRNNFLENDPAVKFGNKYENTIISMKLLATCSELRGPYVEETLRLAWVSVFVGGKKIISELNSTAFWYFEFIQELALLTESAMGVLNGPNLISILQSVSYLLPSAHTELKLVAIKLLCKLAACDIVDMKTDDVDTIFLKTFIHCLQECGILVRDSFFHTLRKYKGQTNVNRLLSRAANENKLLQGVWECFLKNGCLKSDIELRKQLAMTKSFRYRHKCLKSLKGVRRNNNLQNFEATQSEETSKSGNFFDVDMLLNQGHAPEPECKKARFSDETVSLIFQLENIAQRLCENQKEKLTDELKIRLRLITRKLQNVVNK